MNYESGVLVEIIVVLMVEGLEREEEVEEIECVLASRDNVTSSLARLHQSHLTRPSPTLLLLPLLHSPDHTYHHLTLKIIYLTSCTLSKPYITHLFHMTPSLGFTWRPHQPHLTPSSAPPDPLHTLLTQSSNPHDLLHKITSILSSVRNVRLVMVDHSLMKR
ncbi:hypothetical protein Pmani_027002 [Petrolisthes manimaculis]|uniref:Uncharacterized protein n=1 Tax=Petrolisthes manimaculis TaxID=1843537 RepID=A0AAE1P451_9EUCA|nr:hypothetical protein Pmani_027002 [Petrolisthes manimaculis]